MGCTSRLENNEPGCESWQVIKSGVNELRVKKIGVGQEGVFWASECASCSYLKPRARSQSSQSSALSQLGKNKRKLKNVWYLKIISFSNTSVDLDSHSRSLAAEETGA